MVVTGGSSKLGQQQRGGQQSCSSNLVTVWDAVGGQVEIAAMDGEVHVFSCGVLIDDQTTDGPSTWGSQIWETHKSSDGDLWFVLDWMQNATESFLSSPAAKPASRTEGSTGGARSFGPKPRFQKEAFCNFRWGEGDHRSDSKTRAGPGTRSKKRTRLGAPCSDPLSSPEASPGTPRPGMAQTEPTVETGEGAYRSHS